MTDHTLQVQDPGAQAGPPPKQRNRGIHGFTWAIWPWMSWVLPVAAVFIGGNAGWSLIFALMLSPVFVPATGLLGMLPRFLLRKAGHTVTPAPISALLFVHWWAWVAAMISMRGSSDAAPSPALIERLSPWTIAGSMLEVVVFVAIVVAVASWIAILVIVLVTRSRPVPAAGGGTGAWTAVSWTAALLMPVALVAGGALAGAVTAQMKDAAGATVAAVQSEPADSLVAQAVTRHDEAQAQLSVVRALIADDGWTRTNRGVNDRTSYREMLPSYGLSLRFEHDLAGIDVDLDAIRAELLASGWVEGAEGTIVDPDGNIVTMAMTETGLLLSLDTPTWWGDAGEINTALGIPELPTDEFYAETFAADEWPEL